MENRAVTEEANPIQVHFNRDDDAYVPYKSLVHRMLGEYVSEIEIRELYTDKVITFIEQVAKLIKRAALINAKGEYREGDRLYITENQTMIYVDINKNKCAVTIYSQIEKHEEAKAVALELKKMRLIKRKKPSINILQKMHHNLEFSEFEIPRKRIDIGLYYGSNFKPIFVNIHAKLKSKQNGLVILHGKPGTGKTMLIRHLISTISHKSFIFLPTHMADQLASPDFIDLLKNKSNSIVIIEEAESLLVPRSKGNTTPGIANLLNLTDGLLGDILNFKIICSFNTSIKEVDPALLRRGRLLAEYEFGPLSAPDAQQLIDHLGLVHTATQAMTLAEIFNMADEMDENLPSLGRRRVIGFAH